MKNISRVLVLPVALLAANASATCPLFKNKLVDLVGDNRQAIGTTIFADAMYKKDDHFKKAFVCSAGCSWDNNFKKMDAAQFAERVVVDYMIRKGSDAIALDKQVATVLKKIDILPEGMIRDNVNPVVEGVAQAVTHPEVLTYVVLNVVLPQVLGNKAANNG